MHTEPGMVDFLHGQFHANLMYESVTLRTVPEYIHLIQELKNWKNFIRVNYATQFSEFVVKEIWISIEYQVEKSIITRHIEATTVEA